MVFLSRWVWRGEERGGEGVGRGGEGFFGRGEESFFLGVREGREGGVLRAGGLGSFFLGGEREEGSVGFWVFWEVFRWISWFFWERERGSESSGAPRCRSGSRRTLGPRAQCP